MKKVLSLLLVLTILLSCIPATAFAKDSKEINFEGAEDFTSEAISFLANALIMGITPDLKSFNLVDSKKIRKINSYTSIGDSTVFGYGMTDMIDGDSAFASHYGYGVCSMGEEGSGRLGDLQLTSGKAFPLLLCEKLKIKHKGNTGYCETHTMFLDCDTRTNKFAQLSMGGLRAEDVATLLTVNPKFVGVTEIESGDSYFNKTILSLFKEYCRGESNPDSIQDAFAIMRNDLIHNIKNSDLITISLGGNNLSTYPGSILSNNFEDQMNYELKKYIGSTELLDKVLDVVSNFIKEQGIELSIQGIEGDLVILLSKYFLYGYLSVVTSIAKIASIAHVINKDAVIVLTGIYNPADELTMSLNLGDIDAKIKVGRLLNGMLNIINSSIKNYAKLHSNYCIYVDIADTDMIMDQVNLQLDLDMVMDGTIFKTLMDNHGVYAHESAKGHEQIANNIYNVLKRKGCWK